MLAQLFPIIFQHIQLLLEIPPEFVANRKMLEKIKFMYDLIKDLINVKKIS